jgi:hypothetical protein
MGMIVMQRDRGRCEVTRQCQSRDIQVSSKLLSFLIITSFKGWTPGKGTFYNG